MARLPVPGSDSGIWGSVLNDFLNQSHNADGTLKASAVSASGADATTSAKGILQLAGDLAGTAAAPTVPGLAIKADDSAVVHKAGSETVSGAKNFAAGITAQSVTTDSSVRSAFFKTTSSTEHAATIYQAGTSGVDVAAALNVVSDNSQSSAMYLSGTETNRGTLKIAHHGQADGSDAGAAAISVDMQTSGSAAQGIFLTSTSGNIGGNAITVRNNSRDDFVVKSTGRAGIGLPTAATPAGRLDVRQADDSTIGLAMTANSGSAQQMVLLKDSGGNARFEINAAGNSVHRATAFFTGALQLGATTTDLGGSSGSVVSMKDAVTAPTTNPTSGVIVFSEGGVLKWRDPSGVVWPLNVSGSGGSGWGSPSYNGLVAAAYDPATAVNTSAVTAGVLYLLRITLVTAATITKIAAFTTNTPTLTSGQNFAGLYTAAGTLVASTADMTTSWGTSGAQVMNLASSYSAAAGSYYIGLLANGSSPPSFSRAAGTAIGNINLSASSYRFATFGTSQTSLPASFTPASMGNSALAFWAGLV